MIAGKAEAPHKFGRGHASFARELHRQHFEGTVATANGEVYAIETQFARLTAGKVEGLRCLENLYAVSGVAVGYLGPGGRIRRQAADVVKDLLGRLIPIDAARFFENLISLAVTLRSCTTFSSIGYILNVI